MTGRIAMGRGRRWSPHTWAAAVLLAAALLLGASLPRDGPTDLDRHVARLAGAAIGPGASAALRATSDALQPPWHYALGALLVLGVLGSCGRRAALSVLLCIAAAMLLTWGLKRVVQRQRPALPEAGRTAVVSVHAYPSGHVAFVAAALGGLAVLGTRRRRAGAFLAALAGVLLVTGWVALARVHLGRHHVTDTLGGALLGLGLALLLVRGARASRT